MNNEKAKILITKPDNRGRIFYFFSALIVRLLGAEPKPVNPQDFDKTENFDGLILSGGSDINPSLYGSKVSIQDNYDDERDRMEKYLFERASDENKPVLGICRGAQMINVLRGGDLYLSSKMLGNGIESNDSLWKKIFNRRRVNILKNSRLWSIYKSRRAKVNSIHNQSIGELGDGLNIAAVEYSGVIQGIESESPEEYVIGLQWHPELMTYNRENRRIFSKFIEHCDNRKIMV